MIKVYSGKNSLAIFVLFILGIILFLSLFLWGISAVIQLFLPFIIVLAYLLIIVFALGVLPATFVKHMQPSLVGYSMKMSHALDAATWIMSFFIVIKAFGLLGIFFILAFKLMVPIALLGAIVKGSMHIAGHLTLWICASFGMRFYSRWLSNLNPQRSTEGRIIDINAVEVKSQ